MEATNSASFLVMSEVNSNSEANKRRVRLSRKDATRPQDASAEKQAPAITAGDPDQLVTLTSARTEFEGSLMRSVLEDAGIRARVFATSATGLQWEGGYTDPIKVQVRRADLVKAAAVLKKNKQDSVDLDWADVDVGEMEPGAPPVPFGKTTFWERRAKRRRLARIGFTLLTAGLLVAWIGQQAAIPVALFTGAAVIAYWDGDPSGGRYS